MQVQPSQVVQHHYRKYVLWDGEVLVHVYQACGMHGYWSSAAVVIFPDSPMQTRSFDGYRGKPGATYDELLVWVAALLTELSTSGAGEGRVEGLL